MHLSEWLIRSDVSTYVRLCPSLTHRVGNLFSRSSRRLPGDCSDRQLGATTSFAIKFEKEDFCVFLGDLTTKRGSCVDAVRQCDRDEFAADSVAAVDFMAVCVSGADVDVLSHSCLSSQGLPKPLFRED